MPHVSVYRPADARRKRRHRVTITFTSPTSAVVNLPNNRVSPIQPASALTLRHRGRSRGPLETRPWLPALFLLARIALGQTLIEDDRNVASDSAEGWAMRYFAGTTLMTSFGEAARLAPWRVECRNRAWAASRASSDEQQHVGFGGSKQEDLNKSPVFGRLRLALGLPGDWAAPSLGDHAPLQLAGSQARTVFALRSRPAPPGERSRSRCPMRGLGQVGKVDGDITCPRRAAGDPDSDTNPFGCRRALAGHLHGELLQRVDATLGWDAR
mgnify:CR=1 FL=1